MHSLFVEQGITTITKKDLAKEEKHSEAIPLLAGLYRDLREVESR